MSTFTELGLKEEILKALTDLGYEKPSEIQEKAIPQVISSTDDLKAFAQTGTGKTAAFSLPVLQLLNSESKKHTSNHPFANTRIGCSNWQQHQRFFEIHERCECT